MPIAGGSGAAFASAVLFGGTFAGITALTLTLAAQLAPHRSAVLIGLLTAVFGVGQALGPVFAGALTWRVGSFTPALVAAASLIFLAGALMAPLHVRHVDLASSPGDPALAPEIAGTPSGSQRTWNRPTVSKTDRTR